MDDQESIPTPTDPRANRTSKRSLPVYKIRRPMGL
jgi:hypothetical protein